jgi:signal transduction histidine kinase
MCSISTAWKPLGGPVHLSTAHSADCVELTVCDHGLGIPEAELESIFSRFARVGRPEQVGIEGTGLGLPIARQIVELHGGRIWVTSDGAAGSSFNVVLPVGGPEQ